MVGTTSCSAIYIDAKNSGGVTYSISESGSYRFTITGGSYSRYASDSLPGAYWSNDVYIYCNKSIVWVPDAVNGGLLAPGNPDYAIGDGIAFPSGNAAWLAGVGDYVDIHMDAGSYVTLICPDHLVYYSDDRGGMTVSISPIPVAAFKSYNIEDIGTGEIRTEGHHMAGGQFEFDASDSYDPENGPLEYRWDIGGSVSEWSSSPKNITTLYLPEKTPVNLTVRNNIGIENRTSEELDLTLDPGDILVIRSGQPYAGIFDFFGMTYTHIGIYVGKVNGQHMMVESTASPPPLSFKKGVQMTDFYRWGYPHETYVDRIQINTDPETKARAVAFARGLESVPIRRAYDFWFPFKQEGGYIPDFPGHPPTYFQSYNYYCSELVWASYYHASGGSIDLSDHAGRPYFVAVSPDDIFNHVFAISGQNWHHEKYPPKEFGLLGSLIFWTDCPVDIIVTDPSGKTVSNESSQIPDAFYFHTDMNNDGSLDDGVYIPNSIIGNYAINIMPEPEANPTDNFTLRAQTGSATTILADNVAIQDTPSDPYTYRVTSTVPLALPGYTTPPTDPDSDGLYEDLNANGFADWDDAVVLFWNTDWIQDNEPVGAFDFNHNGFIDWDDAVVLFWEV